VLLLFGAPGAAQRVAAERMRDVVPLGRIDILPGR
jgi:hypothetical protein